MHEGETLKRGITTIYHNTTVFRICQYQNRDEPLGVQNVAATIERVELQYDC